MLSTKAETEISEVTYNNRNTIVEKRIITDYQSQFYSSVVKYLNDNEKKCNESQYKKSGQ